MRFFLIFIVLFMLPAICNADKIFLKDGRVIQSDAVWKDGEQVKYRKFGSIVGLAAELVDKIEKAPGETDEPAQGVKFDIWPLGVPIERAMDIAETNDIPLHRSGLISINKGFNPAMSRKYMDTHSHFTYRTHLMGYPADVGLLFSPVSRRLAHVEILIQPPLPEEKKAAYHECMEVLSKKYGKPAILAEKNRIIEETLLRKAGIAETFLWKVGDEGSIRLEKVFSSLKITYMHNHWSDRMMVERKQLADQKTGRNNMSRETTRF